jgi:ketosteroid isomerase-like protein
MFCVKCGATLAEGSVFCENCGAQQNAQPQQPEAQQPAYQQPAHQEPAYQQPAYQQPAYQEPAYQQPAYQQPAYQQPAYQQPAYQQPAYQQPAYQQPAYQPSGSAVGTAVKAAKSGGKAVIGWILAAVVLIGVAVFVVIEFELLNVFKSDEELIRERVEEFETAYNNTDWDAMMDCMDESTRAMMEMVMGFADSIMSDAIGFDMAMSDMFAMSGLMLEGDFCEMEVVDIQINGDTARVTVRMTVDMYGYSDSEEMMLPMVKEGNDWYISIKGEMQDLIGFGY